MRSSLIRPVAWSTSYLLRCPLGISTVTSTSTVRSIPVRMIYSIVSVIRGDVPPGDLPWKVHGAPHADRGTADAGPDQRLHARGRPRRGPDAPAAAGRPARAHGSGRPACGR